MRKSVSAVFSILLLSGSIMAVGEVASTVVNITGPVTIKPDAAPAALLGSTSALLKNPVQFVKDHPFISAALFTLLLAEIRFQTKDTDRLPCRYDFNKFKTGEANWSDVWLVVDDGLIGQQFKPDSVKAGDDGKLVVTALKPSKGILGTVHSYSNAILNAIGVTGSVYLVGDFVANKEQSLLYKLLTSKNSEVAAALIAGFLVSKASAAAAPATTPAKA